MAPYLKVVRTGDTGDEAKELRAQYYALRKRAFEAKWGANLYPDGPDNFDHKLDTTYTLLIEDGKVLAGTRSIFHIAGSTLRTPMETNHPNFHIANLLPQAIIDRLCYCELGGIVADPDTQYHDRHLGTQVTEGTLSMLRSGLIHSRHRKADVVITSASSLGLGPIVRAANKLGIEGVLRRDLVQQEENPEFDTKLWPIVMRLRTEHFKNHLVTDEMKEKGATGEVLADFGKKQSKTYR